MRVNRYYEIRILWFSCYRSHDNIVSYENKINKSYKLWKRLGENPASSLLISIESVSVMLTGIESMLTHATPSQSILVSLLIHYGSTLYERTFLLSQIPTLLGQ